MPWAKVQMRDLHGLEHEHLLGPLAALLVRLVVITLGLDGLATEGIRDNELRLLLCHR